MLLSMMVIGAYMHAYIHRRAVSSMYMSQSVEQCRVEILSVSSFRVNKRTCSLLVEIHSLSTCSMSTPTR